MNSEQWITLAIILLIIFLLLSNQTGRHQIPKRILSGKEIESFTAVNPNTGELVMPSPAGVIIQSSSSGQAVRVCGSASAQAPGLGTSSNQVQIYTNGNPTAVFDTTGLFNKGIIESTSIRATGEAMTGTSGPGLELLYASGNDSCYMNAYDRTSGAFKGLNIQTSGLNVLCATSGAQTTSLACNSTSFTVGVAMTVPTINGTKISSNGSSLTVGVISGDATKMGGYNTGMGYQSLQSCTGEQNTGFGQATLYQCTTGSFNTAIGTTAGGGMVTGSKNIYIGQGTGASGPAVENEIVIGTTATGRGSNTVSIGTNATTNVYTTGAINNVKMWSNGKQSLVLNSTVTDGVAGGVYNGSGDANTGFGWNAIPAITSGQQNTAMGSGSLQAATEGNNNVAMGGNSLKSLTTGTNNIALGQAAGGTILTTGSNNVYLGASTVPSDSAVSNEIVIGQGMTGRGSNTVSIGTYNTDNIYLNTKGSGQAVAAAFATANGLFCTDNYTQAGSNSFLHVWAVAGDAYYDYFGNQYWRSTGLNGYDKATGKTGPDVVMSLDKFGNLSITNSTINAISMRAPTQSVYLNPVSGSVTGSGLACVGIGHDCMKNNTGAQNTGVGSYALSNNVYGNYNTAVGSGVLQFLNPTQAESVASPSKGSFNTGMGIMSLNSLTKGYNNEAFGSGALKSATEGNNNSAIGSNSLTSLTTGSYNVALGQSAATGVLTTGSNNVYLGASTFPSSASVTNEIAIGYGVTGLGSNTINIMNAIKYNINNNSMSIGGTSSAGAINGKYNVFMGNSAGISLTTGEETSGFGQGALAFCTSGMYNSAFGTNSLLSLTTGNYNTGLGHYAGRNLTTGSNNVYIGRESVASSGTATNEIVIGGGGTDSTTNTGKGNNTVSIGNSSTTNVYLNTTAGGTTVIGGGLQVGANASIYLTDTGGVTGTSAYGRYFSAGTGLYQDFTNFFNWRSCGVNGSSNMLSCMSLDLSGNLSVTNAINNVKMWSQGLQSLVLNATTSGSVYNGSGLANTGFGWNAMCSLATGNRNTAFGSSAFANGSLGEDNTVIGYAAGAWMTGSFNTAIGTTALGTGSNNTMFTGNCNTAVGSYAGYNSYTGTAGLTSGPNTYIGNRAMASSAGVFNEIVLGHGPSETGNNVGRGNNTVTIGNSSTVGNYFSGTVYSGGTALTSDFRLKKNIQYLSNQGELQKILQLKPCTFQFNNSLQTHTGFIAQELELVYPEAVDGKKYEYEYEVDIEGKPLVDGYGNVVYKVDKDGNYIPRHRTISPNAILSHSVLAIQELTDLVVSQRSTIQSLELQLQQQRELQLQQQRELQEQRDQIQFILSKLR